MKVKNQLIIPMITTIVMAAIISMIAIVLVMNRLAEKQVQSDTKEVHARLNAYAQQKMNTFYSDINRVGKKALGLAALFAEIPAVQEAYEVAHTGDISDENSPESQKAREMIRQFVVPYVNSYKKQTGAEQFSLHFHLASGLSLCRTWRDGWQTTRNGKRIDVSDDLTAFRQTVLDVNNDGKPRTGIEVGRGGFVIRGVVPIKNAKGKILGSDEVFFSFNDIFNILKSSDRENFATYLDADFLRIAEKLQDPAKYPVIDNSYVLVSSSNPELMQAVVTKELLDQGHEKLTDVQKDHYDVYAFPIQDYTGKAVGVLAMAIDMTDELAELNAIRTNANRMKRGFVIGAAVILLFIMGILLTTNNITAGRIVRAIKSSVSVADALANGNLSVSVQDVSSTSNNEIDQLHYAIGNALNNVKDVLNNLKKLTHRVAEGQLAERGDTTHFQGAWQALVSEINNLIEAFVTPFRKTAACVADIAEGSIPEKDDTPANGDFNLIKDNLNTCIDAINALVTDAQTLAQAAFDENFELYADASHHGGAFREIITNINRMKESMADSLTAAEEVKDYNARSVEKLAANLSMLAEGQLEFSTEVEPAGTHTKQDYENFRHINDSLQQAKTAIAAMAADSNQLVGQALEGNLQARADASRHKGSFFSIVDGINRTMDAIVTPLQETAGVLQSMADGDLTHLIEGNYKGRLNELKQDVNLMASNLNQALSQVSLVVEQVNSSSRQINDASISLSQAATEQAASLEEISSSMSEISTQTSSNAENASEANKLAQQAHQAAGEGAEHMTEMKTAMSAINDSSQKIATIIKVIDDIAFQTNLLALNAAVEAARAGRHGKGFAVVADEVRNLAGRSAKAARETADLIQDSIDKVNRGSEISSQTESAFGEMAEKAEKVAALLNEIANATSEQAMGVSQINSGLQQLDDVTQQNTASSEETASSASELKNQATNLSYLVQKFHLNMDDTRTLDTDDESGIPLLEC
jgi:methyl-accepting chemotaxis protein